MATRNGEGLESPYAAVVRLEELGIICIQVLLGHLFDLCLEPSRGCLETLSRWLDLLPLFLVKAIRSVK